MIEIPLLAIISGGLTISVRLTGILLFAPFLGSVIIPTRIKAILVIALSVLLYPSLGHQAAPPSVAEWPMLIVTEFTIGVGMGIATNIVFEAVGLAGSVLGVQMGYSLVNILDPLSQVDTPVVSLFYSSVLMLLFLRMDVHYWLLRAIGNSYIYLPPGSAHVNNLFTYGVLKIVGSLFGLGIQVAAPVLAATLVADVVLGLLGKASPQMPLMLLGPPVKSLLGLGILVITLKYWPDLFSRLFLDSMKRSEQLLHLAS